MTEREAPDVEPATPETEEAEQQTDQPDEADGGTSPEHEPEKQDQQTG